MKLNNSICKINNNIKNKSNKMKIKQITDKNQGN